MKLGEGIFGDDFIFFSLSKPPKMGYTPVAGLSAQAAECVLTECDPDADKEWPCQKQCFADPDLCKCRCGNCEEPYCDCDNPTGSSSGYYEDYLSSEGGYNFGSDRCHAFGGPAALDSTGPTPEECNCRHCPSMIKDPSPPCPEGVTENCLTPEQVAQCCKDPTEKKPCTNAAGETTPYEWKAQPPNYKGEVCYYCRCPEGYNPKAPTKYICTIGDTPTCQEIQGTDGYDTLPECQAAISSGQCAERWKCKADGGCEETTNWSDPYKSQTECDDSGECVVKFYYCKWNKHQFTFKCEETKDQTWEPPGSDPVQWYSSQQACEQAISGNQGNCATGYTCKTDPLGTFLPSKCQKWPTNAVSGQGASTGGPVWSTEQECQKACCTASEYGSAIGMCMWNEYSGNDFIRRCDVISRSECASKSNYCADGVTWGCEPFFLCCGGGSDALGYSGCNCGDYNGSSCPPGSPDCGTGFQTWVVQPDVFGAGSIESCGCRPAPDQTPANS